MEKNLNKTAHHIKVAASDFDGTLMRDFKVTDEDLQAIARWREAGNKFAIVTGRAFVMLAPHLQKFQIPCDFAVCNNGSLLCEPDGKIVWQTELGRQTIEKLLKEPAVQASQQYVFSAADTLYAAHVSEDALIKKLVRAWDMPVKWIDEAEVADMPPVHQLVLSFAEHEEAHAVAVSINRKMRGLARAYANLLSVDITPPDTSKRSGIEKLLEVKGWQGAEVYAIGDGDNDLPMLAAFHGATVNTARPEIQERAGQVYASVGKMLDSLRA